MQSKFILPFLALFFAFIFSGAQIPRSYKNIVFSVPANYTMATYPEAMVLQYTDENKNSYPMFIYPPFVSSGNAQTDFTAAWNKVYGSFSRTSQGLPIAVKKKHLKGWDYFEGAAQCIQQNNSTFYAWLSIHYFNKEVVAFGAAAPTETLFGYNMVFRNTVLNSLSLNNYATGNLLSRPSSFTRGISGVWQGIRSSALLSGTTGRAEKRIVFYDDGIFCYELPDAGLDSIDRVADEEHKKGYWGTYEWTDRAGSVSFSTYNHERITLNGSNIHFFNIDFEKLRSVDGLYFDGTYTSKTNPKDWWRGHEPLVRFHSDGRFEDNQALFDIDPLAGTYCPTQQPGKGRYICRNFSLILFYDDGRKAQMALYSVDWKNPTAPGFIYAGKDLLKRKN